MTKPSRRVLVLAACGALALAGLILAARAWRQAVLVLEAMDDDSDVPLGR